MVWFDSLFSGLFGCLVFCLLWPTFFSFALQLQDAQTVAAFRKTSAAAKARLAAARERATEEAAASALATDAAAPAAYVASLVCVLACFWGLCCFVFCFVSFVLSLGFVVYCFCVFCSCCFKSRQTFQTPNYICPFALQRANAAMADWRMAMDAAKSRAADGLQSAEKRLAEV